MKLTLASTIDVPVVFSIAAEIVRSNVDNKRQRDFLLTALNSLQDETKGEPYVSFIHIPLLVHAAIRGDVLPAYPLAATTILLFLGIDIMDDLADSDSREYWNGYRREEIELAAMLLLCSLPQLLIDSFNVPSKDKNAMHRLLADSFLKMGSGQQCDLAMARSSCVTVEELESSVIGKSGEEMALYAGLAAYYAGAAKKKVGAYVEFGRQLGAAIQFVSDCHDLFEAPHSRDLLHGARTLPIAFHLERKKNKEREDFLRLLSDAEEDENCHEPLRRRLKASGELLRSAFVIELYCARALQAIDKARPIGSARTALQDFIDHISLFHKKETNKGGKDELRERWEVGGQMAGGCELPPGIEKGPGRGDLPVQDHSH